MSRYTIDQSTWSNQKVLTADWAAEPGFPRDHQVRVLISTADLLDDRGNRFHEGAFRVKLLGQRAPDCPYRTTTFKGETAWMDAERLAGDVITYHRHYNPRRAT